MIEKGDFMKNTSDFYNELKEADSERALDRIMSDKAFRSISFVEYYNALIESRRLSKNKVIKISGISRTYAYQLLNGLRQPGRDNAIVLCIAGGFDLDETNRCLTLLKTGILYAKDPRDAIIIYSITNKMSLEDTNALLYRKKLEAL